MTLRRLAWLAALVLALAGCTRPASEQRVWGCVLLASNADGQSDPAVAEHVGRLREVFGYKRYTVLGSAWGGEPPGTEHWVQPTKEFFLKITAAEPRAAGTYRIEVYQHQRELLQTTAKLPPNKPLFIAGQNYGKGKLVVLLEVKRI